MTVHSGHNSKRWATKRLWRRGVSGSDLAAGLTLTSGPALRVTRALLLVATVGLIACLAVLAAKRQQKWPGWFEWLGEGGDWVPVVLVTTVIALLCILTYRARRKSFVGGGAGDDCRRPQRNQLRLRLQLLLEMHQRGPSEFIAPLLWTVSLIKGGIGDVNLQSAGLKNAQLCPHRRRPRSRSRG